MLKSLKKDRENKRKSGPNYRMILTRVNTRMSSLRAKLVQMAVPAFDSSVLNNVQCLQQAADITVSHRIISKFGEPASKSLKDVAFSNYLKYESELELFPKIDNLWTHEHGYHLRKAKMLLSKWFKTFHIDYDNLDAEFTMGETYTPSNGHVSVFSKLTNLKHWTCTNDVIDDVCYLAYHNRSIKAIAKKHIGRMVREDNGRRF